MFLDPKYAWKNHEKVQSLDHFFGSRVYYRVKNKKNLKLQGWNKYFLFYKVIFQISRILQGQFKQLTVDKNIQYKNYFPFWFCIPVPLY